MKIVLIEPRGVSQSLHSGFAYMAGSLEGDHQVIPYDLNFLDWSDDELVSHVVSINPDIIGVSIKSANVKKAIGLAEKIKKLLKSTLICGGPHITLCGLMFFQEEGGEVFDFGLAGESEISFNQLVNSIGKGRDDLNIPGLIYKKDNRFAVNQPELIIDLNQLKFPNYQIFNLTNWSKVSYPLLTSRGCPYSCIYCSVNKISGRKWRFRSPSNIMEELKAAKNLFNFRSFQIVDDNFTFDMDRVKEFCNLLIDSDLNLTWSCPNGIRADKINPEMINLMKRSGCTDICIGIESGDEKVFNQIKKGEFLADIERAVKIIQGAGIKLTGFFIIGLPGDSIKSTKKTLDLIERLKINGTKWNLLVPYPQTELWDWVNKNGRFLADFTDSQHFLKNNKKMKVVFETPDFTANKRLRAYKIANLAIGNYDRVFKKPKNRFLFYIKASIFLFFYTPGTLVKKVLKRFI